MEVKVPDKQSVSQLWDSVKDQIEKTSPQYKFGHGLTVRENIVSVKTVSDFTGDNTLPITASGVQTTVGNIEALLSII